MHNKHSSATTQHVSFKYNERDAECATKHVDMVKSLGAR
jgi:hypothetical protein